MADSKVTENSLKNIASCILTEKALTHIDTFLTSCTKNEIKGLKIVYSIFKHQGKKKFRPKDSQKDSAVNTTIEELKKRYLKSNYNTEFCKERGPETDILKYRSLRDLKCSEVLNKEVIPFIEQWLTLKDEIEYQDLLLIFLRGMYSVCKSLEGFPTSSHREFYSWNRSNQSGKSVSPLNLKTVAKKSIKGQNKRSESTVQPVNVRKREYKTESPKLIALKSLKGNGEITSWISNIQTKKTSMYQDTFVPIFQKTENTERPDFHTSVVCKLLPSSPN